MDEWDKALCALFFTSLLCLVIGIGVGKSGVFVNDKLRATQIKCGLAHYDDKTGEFKEHGE